MVPQDSVVGPPVSNIYINDFSILNNKISDITLADDTRILISNKNYNDLNQTCTSVFSYIDRWFQANQLVLNVEKTNILKFTPPKFSDYPLQLKYVGHTLSEADNIKFLELKVANHLTWRTHIDQLPQKLSTAYFIIGSLLHVLHIGTLTIVYFAYFHSLVKYCIFWGNNSTNIDRVSYYKKGY
jgi:hypothetical protein